MRLWILLSSITVVIVHSQYISSNSRIHRYFVHAPAPDCGHTRPLLITTTLSTTAATTTINRTTTHPSTTTTTLAPVHCRTSDILFVLDATGSVRHFYERQKRYMASIVRELNIGPHAQHVGLIMYSSKTRQKLVVQMDDQPDKETFLKTVERLPFFAGTTATGAALDLSLQALKRRRLDKRTVVVVLTDGFSHDSVDEQSKKLNVIPNVITIAAGIADPYKREELNTIAGDPNNVFIGENEKSKVLNVLRC